MWRLVLTVVLWNTVSSQPVTDDPQQGRTARQVDFVECCPCPGQSRAGLQDLAAARDAAVDDCPCRLRDADSHGASSDFLPRAVHPVRPFLTSDSPKDDVKPLLKPEVGLASSMLETLREVTDEEYQDALARDAVRNAARVAELGDAQPDTAKNVVTIIVNPREDNARDATPEASQTFESRCAHPAEQVRETENAAVFKVQPNLNGRSLLDMDNSASNVQENFVGLNKALEGLRLKTTPSVLKLFPLKKSQGGHVQSLLKIKDNSKPKNTEIIPKKLAGGLKPKLPKLKLPSLLRNNEDSSSIKPLSLDLNKLNIPRMRPSLARKSKIDDDNNPLTSIIQEQFVPTENKITPTFDLKSLLPATDIKKTTFNLKNLLNLKDVELIPPKSPKITLPDLNLFPALRINKPKTTFLNQQKSDRLTNNCNTVAKETDEVSNERNFHTEILDAIPHASENDPEVAVNDMDKPNVVTENTNTDDDDEIIKTQILDALPSASENNEMSIANENRQEILLPGIVEETTNLDGDLEPQFFEDTVVAKLVKDNVENVDSNDNSVEFFIDNNASNKFEEFEIVQQNDHPETDTSGSASETENDRLDLEIDENGVNIIPPSVTFITNDNEPNVIEGENREPSGFEFESVQDPHDFESFEIAPVQETDDRALNKGDFFRQLPLDLDDVAETSNQNIQILSAELTGEINDSPKNSFRTNVHTENEEQEPEPVPNTDLLSAVKQRISWKIKPIRNSNKKVLNISEPKEIDENYENSYKSSFQSDESSEVERLTEDTENFLFDEKSADYTNNEKNLYNIQDVQQISDSLLEKSEQRVKPEKCECRNLGGQALLVDQALKSKNETLFTGENNNKQKKSDMDSSATSLMDTFVRTSNKNNLGADNKKIEDVNHSNSKADLAENALGTKTINDKTCPSNLQLDELKQEEKSASNSPRSSEIEMASAASEPVYKTYPQKSSIINPGSPLLQQSIVVQPSSLFPPIAPLDLSTVTLPTLDDIRIGISNLLGQNAKAAEDEEIDSTEDCFDSNLAMSSDASTTKTKSALAPFRPLEDINLDIFQINPLSQVSLSSKLPSLNLNSFKTKLALPKTLGLKPMKLQSSLGEKNGGLLGATLTFGPDKISSSRKINPMAKLSSILDRQGSDILGNPLSNMPRLEDLRSKIRANTESLLKTPLPSPLDDTLKTTEALGNSLRYHTENTMRNIQQTLSSTLNEARMSSKTGEQFARPENFLEMVSLAHEDVKDKLHGIHVDLQDRLTSIHDDIIDRSKLRIPMFQSPFFSRLGRLQDSPSSNSRARSDLKKTPSPKLIVRKKKPTESVNKSTMKPKEQNKIKPFKMSKAASSLTPKSVDVPKLMATSSKPPFLRPLQRDENVKLKEPSPYFQNNQRQILSKKKLQQFGVPTKITISTTPRPASFRTRPINRPQFEAKSVQNRDQRPTQFGNQRLGQIKSFSDSRGFASESRAMKVPAPVESIASTEFSINSEEKHDWLRENSSPSSQGYLPEFSVNNPLKPRLNFPNLKPLATPIQLTSSKSTLSPLTLSKPTESPLVSRMREAIRIRFSRPVQTSNKLKTGLGKSQDAEEMTKSASENRSVAVRVEPMKENVSYKCKMVCVRD